MCPRAAKQALAWLALCWLIGAPGTLGLLNSAAANEDQKAALQQLVAAQFADTHDGWSVDEVLLHDERRQRFIEACHRESSPPRATADQLCGALLQVRKRGGELPKSTRVAHRQPEEMERLQAVAEIAIRRVQDELDVPTDALLTREKVRQRFDAIVQNLLPGSSNYLARKSALQLRKSRRLEPELLKRVADWKRRMETVSMSQLVDDWDLIPRRPGVYLFYDLTGYLYIGQAADLRQRLAQHLKKSDRASLAEYLQQHGQSTIHVELHIFEVDSPGEQLRVRRAYESELIRTRRPRFNLAP